MVNFYPQKVPFFKTIKLLFTRRVWLAVHMNEMGQPTGAQVGYDKPKGAQPLTEEVIEQQRQAAQQAQEAALVAEAGQLDQEKAETPQQAPRPPLYSPPKNRQQKRQEAREQRRK
jgi:hypothetical protein